MNLQSYLEQKKQRENLAPKYRHTCATCRQPDFACYCAQVESFETPLTFAILIHPMEARRRIATGRMSHLCLKNSFLITGHDFSTNQTVNSIIENPHNHCVALYPGPESVNLSQLKSEHKEQLFPVGKNPVIFVIDGTWATARKMLRLSPNVKALPRICFSPAKISNFRVRKQPKPECYSTIEAIHHTLELLAPTPQQDKLLKAFDWLVESQLRFIEKAPEPAYRRVLKA